MLLTTALFRSLHGIAVRTKLLTMNKSQKPEYHFAVVSNRGIVHVINGRTGTLRRLSPTDQLQNDWEPFQQVPEAKRKIAKVQLEEKPYEMQVKKPKKQWAPRPKVEPPPLDVCARCEQPVTSKHSKHYISTTKWMCDGCYPAGM